MRITGKHIAVSAAVAAVLVVATPLVGRFEGLRTHVYPDPATHGAPWTYCYGDTANPQFGHTYTVQECDSLLSKSLASFDAQLRTCLHTSLPTKVEAAFLSTAYNIGTGAFCRSSMARHANAGDLTAACNDLEMYVHAGGRVMRGLVVRRGEERALCLEGVREASK